MWSDEKEEQGKKEMYLSRQRKRLTVRTVCIMGELCAHSKMTLLSRFRLLWLPSSRDKEDLTD